MKKIAIVYDRVNKFGGAEQVLLALHELFPDAPLYTSVYSPADSTWVRDWQVNTSFLQHIPLAKKHHEWFGWLMPLAFETLDLSEYDTVISVTSEAAKGVITHPHQLHICYCLTPTRYLWSHTHDYEGVRFRWVKRLVFSKLRIWDCIAAKRPDKIIAISNVVAQRIAKYYGRKVDNVIYPPAEVEGLVSKVPRSQSVDPSPYFLVVSRLVPYKKIDVAITACIKAHKKLVIVGSGSDKERLQALANGNPLIRFVGFVPDEGLAMYYEHATALLCPQEEDFGIVSVEAQSFGVPVICAAKSGMVETVRDGETGRIINGDLSDILEEVESQSWDKELIRRNAMKFSKEEFFRHWKEILHSYSVE